jgi:hypothetical protein
LVDVGFGKETFPACNIFEIEAHVFLDAFHGSEVDLVGVRSGGMRTLPAVALGASPWQKCRQAERLPHHALQAVDLIWWRGRFRLRIRYPVTSATGC